MELIFNELSLKNPPTISQLGEQSVIALIDNLEGIKKIARRNILLYATLELKGQHIAENYPLMQFLKSIKDKDKVSFFLTCIAQKPIVKDYPPYYAYQDEECQGFGVSHDRNFISISLNHQDSWSEDIYSVLKYDEIDGTVIEEVVSVSHFGVVTQNRIEEHLAQKGQMQIYDCNSKFSPRDNQTVLFDENTFIFTGKHYTFGEGDKKIKRKIYRHRDVGTYWYVDNLHYGCTTNDGKAAHLEVFDTSGRHLGIADIQTGEINEKYKEEGRTISI